MGILFIDCSQEKNSSIKFSTTGGFLLSPNVSMDNGCVVESRSKCLILLEENVILSRLIMRRNDGGNDDALLRSVPTVMILGLILGLINHCQRPVRVHNVR